MLRRLKEKLKKRWKDFLGRGRVPTTFKELRRSKDRV
jgi:hypothetical protein